MTQPYRDASPILTSETEDERFARHLTEDLKPIPAMYHELVRILIVKAVQYESYRCAKATMDYAMTISRDAQVRAATLTKGSGK